MWDTSRRLSSLGFGMNTPGLDGGYRSLLHVLLVVSDSLAVALLLSASPAADVRGVDLGIHW